jgi:pyruvate/2-oxoglutarate dehydrogenase complex dihydrolipoamide acyltransferase (E2) component
MARIEVRVPHLGESSHEGVVARWCRQPGERVARDEPLLEIETDKVDAEIPAPAAGRLAERLAVEGQTIREGDLVAVIETDAGAPIIGADVAANEREPEARCPRCGGRMEPANASAGGLPFAGRVRLLVCRACGRVEMFAEDPRTF